MIQSFSAEIIIIKANFSDLLTAIFKAIDLAKTTSAS